MAGRVQDKVTIITGGASGIGEGMVRRFCAEGAKVILADIEEAPGQAIAAECGADFFALDVSSPQAWASLASKVSAEHGRLDVLLNNAGIVSQQSIVEADVDTWNRLMSVNLTGVMLGCQTAIGIMRDNPGGSGGSTDWRASSFPYPPRPTRCSSSPAGRTVPTPN